MNMENYNATPSDPFGTQRELPNATIVLVLGIISIVTCCIGPVSLILAAIALYFAMKDRKLYNANPDMYRRGSYNNLTAGMICAIIGLALGLYGTVSLIVSLSSGQFWEQFDMIRERMEEEKSI
jgi:hypothetical protein